MRQKAEPNFVTYSQVFKGKNNCACSDVFEYNESIRKAVPGAMSRGLKNFVRM